MYYQIDEKAAKHAHEMNSFRSYHDGAKTKEYRDHVDAALYIAERQKAKVDSIYHDKIDGLLDAYARKLADWFNKSFAIEMRCPSVMISGPGNFPVRKKEKQNAARDRHMQAYNDIARLLHKIEGVGTGGISADDAGALDKLKSKLESLERNHAEMKAVNAYYRKHKTLDGCPGLGAKAKAALERYTLQYGLLPTYKLAYNLAEIKRIKGRIAELERRAEKPPEGWKFNGGEVVANSENNRLQIIFDGKPSEEVRTELKRNGFRWSPRAKAWQRQLTNNAIYAARQIEAIQGGLI